MRALSLYKVSREEVDDFFVAATMEGAIDLWRERFGISDDDEPDAISAVEDEVYVEDERSSDDPIHPPSWVAYDEMKAKAERMEKAIRWALGEGSDYDGDTFSAPPHGPDKPLPPYWWRPKLRKMAGIEWKR